MKLFYIANARVPTEKAHGIQIMKMCESFAKLGVSITLVVPWRRGIKKVDPFKYYGVQKIFSITYLPVIEVYTFGYAGFIIGSFSFAAVSFLYGLWNSLKNFRKVVFYSRDQDQFSFFPFFLGLKPYFFEVHGLKKRGFLHKKLFRSVGGVIATNSFIEKKLVENFPLLAGKTILEPNGVDSNMFYGTSKNEARKKLSLDLNKKIVVYAGHFYKWKGVDTLVDASEFLSKDVEVFLVGGNEEDISRIKSDFPKGASRVNFVGYRPYTEIPLWYAASDALVITGTSKDENSVNYTSPIKLFEYLASGRPIIAANSPSIKDVVSENEVYFYKTDDLYSLRDALNYVLENQSEAEQKARFAIKKGLSYSWLERAGRILRFIEKNNDKSSK